MWQLIGCCSYCLRKATFLGKIYLHLDMKAVPSLASFVTRFTMFGFPVEIQAVGCWLFRNPNLVTHEERRDPICHLFWSVTERREISLSPSFCNFWNTSAGVKRSAYLMLKDQFTPRHQIVFICSLSCRIELQSKTSPWKWIKRKHEMAPWIVCRIIWDSGRSKTDFKRDYLHPLVRQSFCCSSWSNKCTPFSVD